MDLVDFRGYLTLILVIVMLLVLLLLLLLVRGAGSFQRVSLGLFVGQLLLNHGPRLSLASHRPT
jgi:hypothetical protein